MNRMDDTPALEISQLSKRFGKASPAVDDLSITVPRRSVYGFLGANGAGKTTTLKLVLGLMRPNTGTIRLFGAEQAAGRCSVGSLIETPSLYDHLTGRENLDITRLLLRLPASEIDRVLDIVSFAHAACQKVGGYSLGMRQRLAIARALLGSPRLLILDEPANGLDPDGIRDMRRLLRDLPETGDVTLIVSSHLLSEVELVATHVGLIHRGKLLLETSMADLGMSDAVEASATDHDAASACLHSAGFEVEVNGSATSPMVVKGAPPAQIAQLLVGQGIDLTHLAQRQNTLEHIYHDHVAHAA